MSASSHYVTVPVGVGVRRLRHSFMYMVAAVASVSVAADVIITPVMTRRRRTRGVITLYNEL